MYRLYGIGTRRIIVSYSLMWLKLQRLYFNERNPLLLVSSLLCISDMISENSSFMNMHVTNRIRLTYQATCAFQPWNVEAMKNSLQFAIGV
ncbi:hypothetical protein VNO78_15749 [Psophocarpus tetragonolobus]|uniref:Uncharacterized protein n=1 Tax=Psophocarpus tetragonolobus TaxID=3891 RepID=A0AAN9XK65_PSOTE